MKKGVSALTMGAMTAALYVVLTFVSELLGLASGAVQIRLSEMLTVLPYFMPCAVPGLFVGCILANILTGCALWDIIFGSVATLLGALGTYFFRKKSKLFAPLFPIVSNTLIIPFVLRYVYSLENGIWYFVLTVGIGEIISCGVLGILLLRLLEKNKALFFQK